MGPCTETLGPSYVETLEGHSLGKPSAWAGEPFLLCCQATIWCNTSSELASRSKGWLLASICHARVRDSRRGD